MTNHLALFDCDGTLVDSQASICGAMERAFARNAQPLPSRHAIRRIVGLSLPHAVQALLPDGEVALLAQLVEDYKQEFQTARTNGMVTEPLYDGMAELLDRLDSAGWLLGIATGKSDRGLRHCLDRHGLSGRFITLQTADRHPSKPDPAMALQAMAEAGAQPETTVIIGDTSFDMMMASNAGCTAIGVDWGYHEPAELRAAGAQQVVTSMDELFREILR
jgi:phosphoglycolate phosphatase